MGSQNKTIKKKLFSQHPKTLLINNMIHQLFLSVAFVLFNFQHALSQPFDIDVEKMQIFGSGCPEGSVSVISSTDGNTVTVLFSGYYAQTDGRDTFDRKSCNLAVPFNIDPNKQVALYKIDYRGYTWVPEAEGSETNFGVEYFFAGTKGPVVTRTFNEEEDIVITDKVPMVWSPCGGSEIFRVNTSIKAKKKSKDNEDAFITIDSVDGTEDNTTALTYYFDEREC